MPASRLDTGIPNERSVEKQALTHVVRIHVQRSSHHLARKSRELICFFPSKMNGCWLNTHTQKQQTESLDFSLNIKQSTRHLTNVNLGTNLSHSLTKNTAKFLPT